MTWSKIASRSYIARTPKTDAFVFGATVPSGLWAWSVYGHAFHESGVENSFREAKYTERRSE